MTHFSLKEPLPLLHSSCSLVVILVLFYNSCLPFFLDYKSHEVWVPCFFFFFSSCLKCWVQSIVKLRRFRQIINECMVDWMNEEQPVQTMFIICCIQGNSVLFYPQTRAITASSNDGEKYEEGKMRLPCFIKLEILRM